MLLLFEKKKKKKFMISAKNDVEFNNLEAVFLQKQ